MANTKLIISQICKDKNITLTDLATRIGITKGTLSTNINKANMTISTMEKIADALGVEVRDLFSPNEKATVITGTCPHCGGKIKVTIEGIE